MKERLYALSQKIIRPIIESPIVFIVLFFVLLLPTLIGGLQTSDWKCVVYACPINLIFAFLLCLLTFVKICGYNIRWLVYCVVLIVAVVESFLILFFGVGFTAMVIALVANTTIEESSGFISNYLYTLSFFLFVCFAAAAVAVLVLADRFRSSIRLSINSRFLSLIMACMVILGCLMYIARDVRSVRLYILHDDLQSLLYAREQALYAANYTTIGSWIYNYICYSIDSDYQRILLDNLQMYQQCEAKQKTNIILVIGEAFNKHHSSLYGYGKETNPQLQKEQTHGRLYVFRDVVSPYNTTIKCMRSIFSFKSQEQNDLWYTKPLFPVIFRHSGYFVTFLSNQETPGIDGNLFDFGNNWLVSPDVAPLLFDWQNEQKYSVDMDLVNAYSWQDFTNGQLLIVHLMGQHAAYSDRYPQSAYVFDENSYKEKDISERERGVLAHYDNATLYNDQVVARILCDLYKKDAVLIYLSDHGEEVYDYRHFSGRDLSDVVTPERAKYQFEVPFMIWMSDKYKENHPDVVAQVERSVDRPFMIDDLPHLMLDLAGIECEWFDPTRSVINDQFNEKRKRLLLDSKQDYDVIMGRRND